MLRRLFAIVAASTVAASAVAASTLALPRPGAPAKSTPPLEFKLLSRTLIEGPAATVSFAGGDVLLGTGNGVAIFREGRPLADPAFVPLQGEPREILVNGPFAYIAAFSGGLEVIDISAPGSPKETYRYGAIEPITCAMAQRTLFVADANARLFVFDLATPREPRFREMKQLPFAVLSLSAENDLVAIVSRRKASVFRAAPNGTLRMLSEVSVENDVKKGILRGGLLFILTTKGEVLTWNLSNAGRPIPMRRLPVQGVADIAVDGDRGMLLTNLDFLLPFRIERAAGSGAGEAGVRIKTEKGFSLTSINAYGQPIATGNPAVPQREKAAGIFMSGKRLAVIYPFEGMRLYELSNKAMSIVGAYETRGFAINLLASKGLLYVANGFDGVRIARVGRDGTVDWIGHLQTAEARDVALFGRNLVIADGTGGLKVADVSDPAKPKIIGRHSSPYFMSALAVAGKRAYLAGGMGGVEIVDIAAAERPALVWRSDFSEVRGISADGRYLYFTDGNEGFRIYSLAKKDPVPLSVLNTPGWNCGCFVAGNTAYLADGGSGVVVVDIANRKKPRTIASLSLNTLTREVFLRGKTLFAAAHTKGVAAIDVSNPEKPAVSAWYDTADDGRGVFADEDFVYAASGSGGVYIFRYLH